MTLLSRVLRLNPGRYLSSSSALSPNPKSLTFSINRLYHESNLDRFLSRFLRLSSSSSLPHSMYTVAVRRLAAAGRLSDAARLLDSHKSRAPDFPASEAFSADLISLYGKAGLQDLALDTFQQLPSLGGPRTVRSFNVLLAALDPDRVVRQFEAIPAGDPEIVPNVVSYSILMRAMCERGDLDGAMGCLTVMEEKGMKPNEVTYNTLLNALYKNDRVEEAKEIWEKMEENKCGPNTRSYNMKMRWLVLKGRTADASELFGEMESKGMKPDGYSITSLIIGYCNDGNLKEAKRLLDDMRRRKCKSTPWTYEALVPLMCEAKEFDSAISLCNESMRNKCYMGVEILQVAVNELIGASRVENAKKLVETAWSSHYSRESLIMPPECLALTDLEEEEKIPNETEKKDGGTNNWVVGKVNGVEGEGTRKESTSNGAYAKIGIIVKSFDKPKYMGAFGVPPDKNRVKLPTTRTLITVLRSPHIDKKSREQFEIKVRREYITIKCQPHELHKKYFWFKRTRILGAQFELVFSYKTRLDMTRLKQSI